MTTTALNLPPPRKKGRGRGREMPGAALPLHLPLPSAHPHPPCSHYNATYFRGLITVQDAKQAEALWYNGYFGHGAAAAAAAGGGGGGGQRKHKKWRLVEAEGLKSEKWFKEARETTGRRGDGVQEDVSKKDLIGGKKEEERQGEMDEMEGEGGKVETVDQEKMMNVGDDKEKINENKEMQEVQNMESDERERKEKEKRNMNNKTSKHHMEESEESEEESAINYEGEMEVQSDDSSDSEEREPWRTVLVLSSDQKTATDTHNDPDTYLSLLPEEALFLSYALGCLVLTYEEPPPPSRRSGKRTLREQDVHEMSIDEMWRVFTQDDPTFPVKYAAFHHFRTQGWVVKSGLKYGVDYVLYPVGPPFYHSQYAVKVHSVWSDTLTLDHSLPGHSMTWTTVATTERLANHVNKIPVICFVLRPRSLIQPRLSLIECLKELKVQELVLGRWNPTDGSG